MPDILIRGLNKTIINKLKVRAARSGRSLQAEVKEILDRSAGEMTHQELRRRADEVSKRFEGRRLSDSTDLIREDRDR
jgi:antitoxin FitA